MDLLYNLDRCTGCCACMNICPAKAISMEFYKGFRYPNIDFNKCLDCGLCTKTCPKNDIVEKGELKKAYSFTSNDSTINKSSSGGFATSCSKLIIEKKGCVIGSVYDDRLLVSHSCISKIEDLEKIQGSKYVESFIGQSFLKIKKMLSDGTIVLFIGTPCQVGGLLKFLNTLNIKTDNLYTIDLLCGGVPSPYLFKKYIAFLENKHHCKILNFNFRSKKYGYGYLICEANFEKTSKILKGKLDGSFIKCIGKGYIRKSCFACPYACEKRVSDITIGDFWNLNIDSKQWKKGVSLVLPNTEKGAFLFEQTSKNGITKEQNIIDARNSQTCSLRYSKNKPLDYLLFFDDSESEDWRVLANKYFSEYSFEEKILDILPMRLSVSIRNFLKRRNR